MESFSNRVKGWSVCALLPPLFSICVAVGLFVVYFVAVAHGKVTPLTSQYEPNEGKLPPYISIAGNYPPASCIFSQIMNLGAFAGFFIGFFRYLQVKNMYKPWLNTVCFLVFSCSCFGMTIIGNFQVFIEEEIHNFGTFLTFGLGALFCWTQSWITLKVNFKKEGFKTSILRFLLSAAITVCLTLYSTLMLQGLHMHAARGQWALVMFLLIFIGTFCVEFRHGRMVFLVTDVHEDPVNLTFTELSADHLDT